MTTELRLLHPAGYLNSVYTNAGGAPSMQHLGHAQLVKGDLTIKPLYPYSQAVPASSSCSCLQFCILQAIKTGGGNGLGTRLENCLDVTFQISHLIFAAGVCQC